MMNRVSDSCPSEAPIDPVERLLFQVMVALVVRRPDGLETIEATLEAVIGAGLELGYLRDTNAPLDPSGLH